MKKATTKKRDTSVYAPRTRKLGLDIAVDPKIPWTKKQLDLMRLVQSKECKLIFISGPAGTSKSILAVYLGLLSLKEKKTSEIVYFRSAVESSSRSLGFLPGDLNEKVGIYLAPLMEKLDELIGPENTKNIVEKGLVSGKPINYLRGCQFSEKFVIGDEFQNVNMSEMTTFLTRIGEFSKVLVLGDPMQSDIGKASAFKTTFDLFNNEESKQNGIFTFEFGEEDIVRSEILKFIVKTLKKE